MTEPLPVARRRPARRARILVVAGAVTAVVAVAMASAGVGRGTTRGEEQDRLPPATAVVSRGDLADLRTVRGVLAFGEPTAVVGRLPGTVTQLAPVGSEVRRGGALFFVDDRPVVLFYGPRPMWRELGVGSRGRDVRQVEENLVALGYDGITVDDRYTAGTARAVRRWQEAGGMARTGRISTGQLLFTAGPVRVADHRARLGDPSTGPVVGVTGTARLVSAQLPAADERLAVVGAKVTVVLPDDRPVTGTVAEVRAGTEARTGRGPVRGSPCWSVSSTSSGWRPWTVRTSSSSSSSPNAGRCSPFR